MPSGLRSASALTAGSVTTGLLAYVFFALTTRALGATGAAPVSVLWTWWGFTAAALTFPVQHWAARTVAAHRGEWSVRAALPRIGLLTGAVAAVAAGGAWLLREPLFGEHGAAFTLLTAAVVPAATGMGLVRGVLSARGRFTAVAAVLVAENAIRCLLGLVLLLVGTEDPAAYGLALLAGYAAILLWPSSLRPTRTGERTPDSPVAFLGATAGGQLVAQAVLTGSPVVLALGGAPARDVTVLFAGLAVFRAPYLVAIGQVTQLTGTMTRLVLDEDGRRLAAIRRGLVVLTVLAAGAAAGVGALLGPWLLPLVFGDDVRLGARACALLASASTVALGTLVATVLVIASGRPGALLRGWAVAVLPGAAWLALVPGELLLRTCVAFLLVELVAFGWFVVESSHRRRGTGAVPGSVDVGRAGSPRGEEDGGTEG